MLKNISFLALAGMLAISLTACILVTDDGSTTNGDGDGDGDSTSETAGDGDGDTATGDGDGDGDSATGDGDGDSATGDGDGDGDTATGDGDGDTGVGGCGWNAEAMYYECGGVGEDPEGTNPIACPEGLVMGDPCDAVEPALSEVGCCDAEGNNWYCGENDMGEIFQFMDACGG